MLGRPFASIAVLLTTALLAAGCGRSERVEESRIIGDTLTVYSSLPQTGPMAPVSRDLIRAEKLALEEAGGRAGDYKVSYVSLDSADPKTGHWEPRQVADNARTAVEDLQTIAYLGELEAGASAISLPILNEGGMLQVSPGDTFTGLTEPGAPGEPEKYYPSGRRTFARMVPTDAEQVDELVALLGDRAARRVFLADDGGVGARGLLDRLAARLKRDGVEVVDRERLDPRGEVPEELPGNVLGDRADAFVYAGSYRPFATDVLRAVHAGAPRVALFAADGVATGPDVAQQAGAAADRLLLTGVAPEEDAAFRAEFRERYGTAPHRRAILGYRAMRLVLRAIEGAGADAASRPAVIRRALAIAEEPPSEFASFRIVGRRLLRAGADL